MCLFLSRCRLILLFHILLSLLFILCLISARTFSSGVYIRTNVANMCSSYSNYTEQIFWCQVNYKEKANKYLEYMFAIWKRICYTIQIQIRSGIRHSIRFQEPIKALGGNYMGYGKISKKQSEILEFIKDSILTKGYPPAVREICEAVHLKSTSSVHSHL